MTWGCWESKGSPERKTMDEKAWDSAVALVWKAMDALYGAKVDPEEINEVVIEARQTWTPPEKPVDPLSREPGTPYGRED